MARARKPNKKVLREAQAVVRGYRRGGLAGAVLADTRRREPRVAPVPLLLPNQYHAPSPYCGCPACVLWRSQNYPNIGPGQEPATTKSKLTDEMNFSVELNGTPLSESDANAIAMITSIVALAELGRASVTGVSFTSGGNSYGRRYSMGIEVSSDIFPAFGDLSGTEAKLMFADRMVEFWNNQRVALDGKLKSETESRLGKI